MTQTLKYDSRHAIVRARFFLKKARECRIDSREDFEAYLEAAIVFARAAILRVKHKYEKESGFINWWGSLKNNSSIMFFKEHRDMILKEAPAEVGQILKMPLLKVNVTIGSEPEGITSASSELPEEILYASDLYYFEKDPSISATDKVEEHLNELEAYINNFIESLNAP
jgi:hypothetical protein